MTEEQFQRQVIELAELCGWAVFHVHDSRRSNPGWPDLVLCRPPEILFAELKTDKGRIRLEQMEWIERLTACGLEAYVWRPEVFDERIKRRLNSPRQRMGA